MIQPATLSDKTAAGRRNCHLLCRRHVVVDDGVAVVDNGDVDHAKDPSLCWCGRYRQVEVEGSYGVQVAVDGGRKLSLIALQIPLHCIISLRSLQLLHCTPFSFNAFSPFHYQQYIDIR